jgi:hypothetical protein
VCHVSPLLIFPVHVDIDVWYGLYILSQWIDPFVLSIGTFPCTRGMLETPETFSSRLSFTGLTMREIFLNGMWIVFMLNRLSNLFILYDMVCWNGKMATQSVFLFLLSSSFYDT